MIDRRNTITTDFGAMIENDGESLTVGEYGPVLEKDIVLNEKVSHFAREKIPDRIAFAKGVGAHGYFQLYEPLGTYTQADFLKNRNQITPLFARFSMMTGDKGSPDTARDVRGLALKFYTDEGNQDLIFSSIPVTFLDDAIRIPDYIHALRPSPETYLFDKERFFDFYSMMPEGTNHLLYLYSKYGIRKSYYKMPYFGVGVLVFVNKDKKKFFARFTLMPLAETEDISQEEATLLSGLDPDIAGKDFYETLKKGDPIQFHLCVQIREAETAICNKNWKHSVYDPTFIWDEQRYPLLIIGKIVLDQVPQNYFAEVEQSAFSSFSNVRGIELSPDRFLHGLSTILSEDAVYRLGINYSQLPINLPEIPVHNNEQNGKMRYMAADGSINYRPSTIAQTDSDGKEIINENSFYFCGFEARKPFSRKNPFEQAGNYYLDLNHEQADELAMNLAIDLTEVNLEILEKVLGYFEKVNKKLAEDVRKYLDPLRVS